MAGHDNEAFYVLEQLADNALKERRYRDAAYYNWLLGMEYLHNDDISEAKKIQKYDEKLLKAEGFYAYDAIHRYFVTFVAYHYS